MHCIGELLPYFLFGRRTIVRREYWTTVSTKSQRVISIGRLNPCFVGSPRILRYVFVTEDEVKLREFPAGEVSVWTHMILGTGQ